MRNRWIPLSFLILVFLIFPARTGNAYAIPWTEIDPGRNHSQTAHLALGGRTMYEPYDYSEPCLNRHCGYMSVIGSLSDKEGFGAAADSAPAPVPEPATLVLLGCGIAGLGLLWRRSKHHGP